MDNINYIKQIPILTTEIEELQKKHMGNLWSGFIPPVINNIYKDLCLLIPEAKRIPIGQLFDMSIHPEQNKQILFKRLNVFVKNSDKLNALLNELWNKMSPLWKKIDTDHNEQLTILYNKLTEMNNSDRLDSTLSTYESIIDKYKNITDVEEYIRNVDNNASRLNLLELFKNTKNIIKIKYFIDVAELTEHTE
jgi:hypothetical protein